MDAELPREFILRHVEPFPHDAQVFVRFEFNRDLHIHTESGTPAVQDHVHVGARLQSGATSTQSPCLVSGASGVPLTSAPSTGPFGTARKFKPSAPTFTINDRHSGSAHGA